MRKFNHIDIIAKRWFQRTYGNTYHSVAIVIDGEIRDKIEFTYGYGEAYLQTAHKLLAKHGIFDWQKTKELVPVYRNGEVDYHTPKESQNESEAYNQFIQYTRDYRDKFAIVCSDVANKKEL
jgi:hypothetical protein